MSAAFDTAREAAEQGLPVFPLHHVTDGRCSCGKPDCSSPGKHPRTSDGFKAASTDERKLLHWNDRWPDANWGCACGDRVSVVDIDAKAGADPREVIADHALTGPTVWTGTALDGPLAGTRGAHVYCQNGVPTGKSPEAGVEVKAAGGYVLLPGSRHVSGVAYEWADERRPWLGPLSPVPDALVPAVQRGPAPAVEEVIPKHQRNTTLTSMAGSVRRRGATKREILALLAAMNERCQPSLSSDELQDIARSVSRYEPAAPALAQMNELATLLGFDQLGRSIVGVDVYGRGSSANVRIDLDDGQRLVLYPVGKFATGAKLAQETALQVGASPGLKAADVIRVLVLIRELGHHADTFKLEDQALELGSAYLHATPVEAVDMSDQASKWGAWSLLGHLEVNRKQVVLEDPETGIRYVRVDWFRSWARTQADSGTANEVVSLMTVLGWEKRGRDGRIKATSPTTPETLQWSFFMVPPGW